MATVEKISIALPQEMVSLVKKAVTTGEYASSSEVVRDAFREWTQRRKLRQEGVATLRKAWRQATRESSAGVDAEGVLRRLERKYEAMAKVAEQSS